MKKLLVALCLVLIAVPIFVVWGRNGEASSERLVVIKNVHDENVGGWVWKQKQITEQADIEKILDELQSLNLTIEAQDQSIVYGASLMIEYTDEKGNKFSYLFVGDKVSKNGVYYTIEYGADRDLHDIYDSLKNKESRWSNL